MATMKLSIPALGIVETVDVDVERHLAGVVEGMALAFKAILAELAIDAAALGRIGESMIAESTKDGVTPVARSILIAIGAPLATGRMAAPGGRSAATPLTVIRGGLENG